MKKRINSEPIIGNLLIGQKKGYISNEELYNYYDTIDQLLPEEYYTYNSISLDEFCFEYSYLVTKYKDIVIPTAEKQLLKRYFRLGLPSSIVSIFDKATEIVEEDNSLSEEYMKQYLEYKESLKNNRTDSVNQNTEDIDKYNETMKKYLGIVKIYEEQMGGTNIIIKSRTDDDETIINKWFNLYPNSEHVMLQNTNELDSMFEIFKDMTPITKEEKQDMKRVKVLHKKLMSENE